MLRQRRWIDGATVRVRPMLAEHLYSGAWTIRVDELGEVTTAALTFTAVSSPVSEILRRRRERLGRAEPFAQVCPCQHYTLPGRR